MNSKIRRFVFGAGVLGGLLGAGCGAVSAGTVYSVAFGAILGVLAGLAAVLYWSEHSGASRRHARRARHPSEIPHPRDLSTRHVSHRSAPPSVRRLGRQN